ncbi:MAG TPA: fibronectin type III domain-containing protein, partial [Verrucomicrobiae bacterium]
MSLLFAGPNFTSFALDAREYAVEISVEVLSSPFALRLNWQPSSIARTYTIRRRPFGTTDWGGAIATLPGTATQYTDTAVSSGNAYEYEVQLETTVRNSGWVYAYGYVLAGGNVAWPDLKGKVILIVDDVAAGSLGNEIAAFQRELLAAGWFPIRRDLSRTTSVPEVKNIIRAEYNADPGNVRSVILFGNVPVPYSGNIAPDLHESHRGAWPADAYYAEMNGNWTDNSVNVISGDYAANNNTPGDGKFDQSQIPTSVELEIGRIDFADMPAFSGRSEVDLLRNYLKKNSDYRRRVFTATPRMLVRDNFGDLSGDAPAVDAWRHYRQMFGPGAVREVGPNGFFSTLQNESFLWAYGGGGGGLTKADTIGTTWDFAAQNPRAVFLILHGSYFGDWNTRDNFLRAAIGSQSYTLASIWSGLPHWFMHPMGLGRSIGHSTRISQNNINEYRNYQNFAAQQVHIALIGDPTLENYPVIPPSNLSGTAGGANVNLNWSASSDQNVVGYFVYHSANANGPFQRITGSPVATSYAHAIGIGTHHYMVRAVKLERTGSGMFYNYSQGIFTSVTKSSGGALPVVTISADDANAAEPGTDPGTFKLVRNVADASPLTVDLLIGGTAQNGTDYRSLSGSAQIPAGSTTETISIVPLTDNLIEGEETVTIEIKLGSAYTIGTAKSALVRIADAPNEPPVAAPQNLQSVENTTLAITLNGQDPENQPLTYRIVTQPT